jgi:hypothetical protein
VLGSCARPSLPVMGVLCQQFLSLCNLSQASLSVTYCFHTFAAFFQRSQNVAMALGRQSCRDKACYQCDRRRDLRAIFLPGTARSMSFRVLLLCSRYNGLKLIQSNRHSTNERAPTCDRNCACSLAGILGLCAWLFSVGSRLNSNKHSNLRVQSSRKQNRWQYRRCRLMLSPSPRNFRWHQAGYSNYFLLPVGRYADSEARPGIAQH